MHSVFTAVLPFNKIRIMREKILLLTALSLITAFSFSQSIGIKLGVNLATIADDDSIDNTKKMVPGLYIGIPYAIAITDKFSIQPELAFVQKGGKTTYDDHSSQDIFGVTVTTDYHSESTVKLNYLEIPILLKYAFATEGFMPYIGVGPSIGFAMSGNQSGSSTTTTSSSVTGTTTSSSSYDESIDFEQDSVSKIDFSLLVTLGGAFPIGDNGNTVSLNLSYMLGLANLNNSSADLKLMNRGILITAGFSLDLGKK